MTRLKDPADPDDPSLMVTESDCGATVTTDVPPDLPAARRKGGARPVPTRNELFSHLTLAGLRSYRRALDQEESKVSYWRRILQARLDVVHAGSARELDAERLRPLLTSERVGAGRSALVHVLAVDDIPPLPCLDELWERVVGASDSLAQARLEADLRAAELELSAYRGVLHRRLSEATCELIARYREEPDLCLSALPLSRPSTP